MRARRSAGRRELALWLQREQVATQHVPGTPSVLQVAVDGDRLVKGIWSMVPTLKEFTNMPTDLTDFGERQGRNKINSLIFKIKLGSDKKKLPMGNHQGPGAVLSGSPKFRLRQCSREKSFREGSELRGVEELRNLRRLHRRHGS